MRRTPCLLVLLVALALLGVVAPAGAALATADGPRYSVYFDPATATITPGAGHLDATGFVLDSNGHVDLSGTTTQATTRIDVDLYRVVPCEGPPRVVVSVDGTVYLDRHVHGPAEYALAGHWAAGPHTVRIRMAEQHSTASCHRSIAGQGTDVYGWSDGLPHALRVVQFATVTTATLTPAVAHSVTDEQLSVSADTTVSVALDSQGARTLFVNAVTGSCDDSRAHVVIRLDGALVYDGPTGTDRDGDGYHSFDVRPANGDHVVTVAVTGVPPATDQCRPSVRLWGFFVEGWA